MKFIRPEASAGRFLPPLNGANRSCMYSGPTCVRVDIVFSLSYGGRSDVLKDALQQIRQAEVEAAEIVAQARHEANQVRERTAREIRDREEAARKASAARRQDLMAEAEERGRRKAADLLELNRVRIRKLRDTADERRADAVSEITRGLIG